MASKIPGGGGEVKLNSAGMRELLKSDPVTFMLIERMRKVENALPGSYMEVMKTRTRTRVKVVRGSDFEEANTGDLSRALDLAGGLRGTRTRAQMKRARAKRRQKGTY